MKKEIEVSVKIFLPNGVTEEHVVGQSDVTSIMELEGVPGIVLTQGKSEITYCGVPYIYKEKSIDL